MIPLMITVSSRWYSATALRTGDFRGRQGCAEVVFVNHQRGLQTQRLRLLQLGGKVGLGSIFVVEKSDCHGTTVLLPLVRHREGKVVVLVDNLGTGRRIQGRPSIFAHLEPEIAGAGCRFCEVGDAAVLPQDRLGGAEAQIFGNLSCTRLRGY